jgi:hypothetical protein
MGLLETIRNTATDVVESQPKTVQGTVKSYHEGVCTVDTVDGVMENLPCVNIPKIGSACLVVPSDGEYTCIPHEIDDTLSLYSLGLGKFWIDDNGDLQLELAIGTENYFSIDNNGDLIVDLDGDSREENFSINDDGDVIYEL